VSESIFAGRRVILGVTGGIASYKSAWLSRLLAKAGAEVDVIMTASAAEFIGPITFEALVGRQVHTSLIAVGSALDHIRLAREAHAIVVAPATADFMARAANGQANDLLTAVLLATSAPVLLVPAMNDRMWAHPATRRNADTLRALGYDLMEPAEGMLAAGEGSGPGRMPEPEEIFSRVARLLGGESPLRGRRVLVTGGPTREPIDPVRFISNRSSGKMAVAVAAAAWQRGAEVTLIAGPMSVRPPEGVTVIDVTTTREMKAELERNLPEADVLVMAAAPADYAPAEVASQKIRRDAAGLMLSLAPTDDLLASTVDRRRPGAVVVGFALDTGEAVVRAREKLERKSLDLIVANDALEPGAGFEGDTNRVTFLAREGEPETLPLMPKSEVAHHLLNRVERILERR
jgi:phosphopantothenoylcysteine decarboxylase / phosphopantothenate---cysteine ligase